MNSKKIGRNDPCPCGSGKKYKKCCLDKKPSEAEVIKLVQEVRAKQILRDRVLQNEYGYYLNHVTEMYKGKRIRALASKILWRSKEETFHEFLIYVFKVTMGQEWADREFAKPASERHFIAQCYDEYIKWQKENKKEENLISEDRYAVKTNGYVKWLMCLAFDLYCLQHTNQIPNDVLERLKSDGDSFQGARYEIAVASIFARVGFNISFFNENDPEVKKKKHCDFIAEYTKNNLRIAVEAKSRHRPAILHDKRKPFTETKRYLKADIHPLLKDAMEKNVGEMPYMIFVDLNAKHTPELELKNKPWLKGVIDKVGQNTEGDNAPHKANLITITNFSFHYQGVEISTAGDILHSIAFNPKYPISKTIRDMIINASNNYSKTPDLDEVVAKIEGR